MKIESDIAHPIVAILLFGGVGYGIYAMDEIKSAPKPVRWATLDKIVSESTAAEIRAYISETRENISDHLPVVTRFYFTDKS